MFVEERSGLSYVGKHHYSLLEGKTSKGYTSDILFIYRDTTEEELKNGFSGEIVTWIYGASNLEALKGIIQYEIKKYEEKDEEDYEII